MHNFYNNKTCANCANEVCKVYGGVCKKKERIDFFAKIRNFFKRGVEQ